MTYEEYLAKYGELTYRNVGVSMLPLIRQGRDTFTVRALHPGELCRRWDVVLYTRPPQSYVLHRIISVPDGGYDILGDNCVSVERNIPRERVIGVMTGYVRRGRKHSTAELGYRLYVALYCKPYRFRIALRRLGALPIRAAHFLKRTFGRRSG